MIFKTLQPHEINQTANAFIDFSVNIKHLLNSQKNVPFRKPEVRISYLISPLILFYFSDL